MAKDSMTPTDMAVHMHKLVDNIHNPRDRMEFAECKAEYKEVVVAAAVLLYKDIYSKVLEPLHAERDELKAALRELVGAAGEFRVCAIKLQNKEKLFGDDEIDRIGSQFRIKLASAEALLNKEETDGTTKN